MRNLFRWGGGRNGDDLAADVASGGRSRLHLTVRGQRVVCAVAVVGLFGFGAAAPNLISDDRAAASPSAPDTAAPPSAAAAAGEDSQLGITGALPGEPLPAGPLDTAPNAQPDTAAGSNIPPGQLGIPGVVLDAYRRAERALAAVQPGCHLSWALLASIGRIESGHASGGRVDVTGNTLGPILGPRLDGSGGTAAIADTDRGALDGDPVWDRAVGPMQFIPSTWRSFGVDGNGDGIASPHNIYDAARAAGGYLCGGGGDLSDPAQLTAAVFRYNHSASYVAAVLRWVQAYQAGVVPTPSEPGPVPPAPNANGGLPISASGAPTVLTARAAVAAPLSPSSRPPGAPPAPVTLDAASATPPTSSPTDTTPTDTTAPRATTPPATTTNLPVTTPPTTTAAPPPTTPPAATTTTTTTTAPPNTTTPPAATTTGLA